MEGSFNALLAKSFPKMLALYAVQFPNFMYISNNEYQKAIKDPSYSPYAVLYGGIITGRKDTQWAPVQRDPNFNQKKTFIQFTADIVSDTNILNPPEIVPTPEDNNATTKKSTEKKVTIATIANAQKVNDKKPILKKNSTEVSTSSSSKTESGYRIQIEPLNSRYSYNNTY
jgi:hypothetical protein